MSKELSINLRVSVSDDSFDTSLSFPVSASKEQIDNTVKAWLDALKTAVSMCAQPPAQEKESQ